jgi:hypothetical protein
MMIELTTDEKLLWDQIHHFWTYEYNTLSSGWHSKWKDGQIGVKQRDLTLSIRKRNAVPERRWRWVTDPEFNIGGSKSFLDVFMHNMGCSVEGVFEHAHWYSEGFLPFLLGVIKLPDAVVDEFRKDRERGGLSPYEMGQKYRQKAKSLGMDKSKVADEFHKLAADCDYHPTSCRSIRDAIFKHLR